ncbi:MAG TPA: YceI family protein [Gaiellaceae bacterium]|nr:YceI family protein [Gaiellaceae bacterium]
MAVTTQRTTTRRWVVDETRSSVGFEVRNFWGLAAVRGSFDSFDGSYTVGPNGSSIELTIDATSIDTGNERRDHHLRSADFFDADEFPEIRFTSSRIVDLGDGRMHVSGELEAAGTTTPLAFNATVQTFVDELEFETTADVDQRNLGMSSGPLWSIRRPATLYVKTRLVRVDDAD